MTGNNHGKYNFTSQTGHGATATTTFVVDDNVSVGPPGTGGGSGPDLKAQHPDRSGLLSLLLAVEVSDRFRPDDQLAGDPGQAAAREGLDFLHDGVNLADRAVGACVDAAHASPGR